MTACPHCGQPMPEMRCGVRLTPLKARIFDLVKRAGADGIAGQDLFRLAYRDEQERRRKYSALKHHIHQINEAIGESGLLIIGRGLVWRLVSLQKEAAE